MTSAREAYCRREWKQVYQTLLALKDSLDAADLELLGTAAYLNARDHQPYLERAYALYDEDGEEERASRCAFWIGLLYLLSGESARAGGWLARGRRLIEGHECVETGYHLVPICEQRLQAGESASALEAAEAAAEVGERFDDADLVAIARHLQGRAWIQMGETSSGLMLLDEAMLGAVSDGLSPIITGLIYCSVIETCQEIYEVSRAGEWTEAFDRWCNEQSDLVAFTGTCRVCRAEILQFHGDWRDAMEEAVHACERAEGGALPAALYRRAEIHRLRGEFARAEEIYREAAKQGREPQPGMAYLRLAQGRARDADAALRRVLAATDAPPRRAPLLGARIEVALARGDDASAREACRELAETAERLNADVLRAAAAYARGAIALYEDGAEEALVPLQWAVEAWRRVEAPYEEARTRVLIGRACRLLGDVEAADIEVDAAAEVFRRLGATPDLERLNRHQRTYPLTSREMQVLRLIAAGKTNRAIASDLYVSPRTIDRHVSSILSKLDVPTRAAATAYAYDHQLL